MNIQAQIAEKKNTLWNDDSLSEKEYDKLSQEVVALCVQLFDIQNGTEFVFSSPYEQYKNRIGNKAKVISAITDPKVVHWESAPLYLIEFEDGEQIHAHPEEVKPELILAKQTNS